MEGLSTSDSVAFSSSCANGVGGFSGDNENIPSLRRPTVKRKRVLKSIIRKRSTEDASHISCERYIANVRERQRTKNLNEAYRRLRELIPTLAMDKPTKVETLRLAMGYISFLNDVLTSEDAAQHCDLTSMIRPAEFVSSSAAECFGTP